MSEREAGTPEIDNYMKRISNQEREKTGKLKTKFLQHFNVLSVNWFLTQISVPSSCMLFRFLVEFSGLYFYIFFPNVYISVASQHTL